MKGKIQSFIKNCLAEYPVDNADVITVRIDAKYSEVRVSLYKYGNPLSYNKEVKLAEIEEREDIKSVALEVFK